jgi:hypothetical protein
MKSFITLLTLCLLALCVNAQQPQVKRNNELINSQKINSAPGVYTYKIFQAPNKLYGYDILKNGRNIFHQPVPASTSDPLAIKQKTFAEKAAALSIEKLRTQTFASLSPQEIKNIISQ